MYRKLFRMITAGRKIIYSVVVLINYNSNFSTGTFTKHLNPLRKLTFTLFNIKSLYTPTGYIAIVN